MNSVTTPASTKVESVWEKD